jgi:carboxypeptidase D
VDYWSGLFSFNNSFNDYIHEKADRCGYTSYLNTYLAFPPAGPLPNPNSSAECDVWDEIANAVFEINPCFDYYQVATTCPQLWDVLGFPGSNPYLPAGASVYFNRTDVQEAINAPVGTNWMECTNENVFVNGTDNSPPSGLSVLPHVIERTNRTVIGHGALDYILIANGTLLMIQNMTWNGKQGFQAKPSGEFFVPYHIDYSQSTLAGAGVFGTVHTERGLTYVTVDLSGHSKFSGI